MPQLSSEFTLSEDLRVAPGAFAAASGHLDGALRELAAAYPSESTICVDELRAFAGAVDG